MEHIGEIEQRLWSSADTLRANSEFASNEYFLPVMGLIFLRHGYSRFLKVKDEIETALPSRGGKKRELTKADFSQKGSIFLQPKAQFEYLANLPESANRQQAIIDAMDSIEADYENLKGTLPKNEYQQLDNDVLGSLLRTFNDPALKRADGDIFGRIYEYFLTQFADQKAHDGGEFFTPVSLVQMIVNVIEPDHGKVLDPACGSGGMFVQSAHFMEGKKKDPTKQVTFYGMEKNATTIRLAKMNLAVHGLEGNIAQAITYYNEPHELVGKADFVMATPPFNVDEIDAGKIKNDPRLPYKLPSVNKGGKVGNGNYVWISYFDAYLNDKGRAGFVMSSQASSAGGEEKRVREDLVKSGHVDAMIAIRGNFFYTRTVPCELWFFDKGKPKAHYDKLLMIDARGVHRKVTRKIFDFSPEQLANLTSIVWLYRGQSDRFIDLLVSHLSRSVESADAALEPTRQLMTVLAEAKGKIAAFFTAHRKNEKAAAAWKEFEDAAAMAGDDFESYSALAKDTGKRWGKVPKDLVGFKKTGGQIAKCAEAAHDLICQIDHAAKLFARAVDLAEKELGAKENENWSAREVKAAAKALEEARESAVERLRLVRYFYRHAHWLAERFPDAKLRDVEGLVKVVSHEAMAKNDWSLTPGRYVGVAKVEEDDDFDFEDALREIHVEIEDLNTEAASLARAISKNFKALGL